MDERESVINEGVIELDPEASKRFVEEVVEPSSVKDGKTYAERMREKAERARHVNRDPGDETDAPDLSELGPTGTRIFI